MTKTYFLNKKVTNNQKNIRLEHNKQAQEIESFFQRIVENNILPVSAGGDHSITYPILKALFCLLVSIFNLFRPDLNSLPYGYEWLDYVHNTY